MREADAPVRDARFGISRYGFFLILSISCDDPDSNQGSCGS